MMIQVAISSSRSDVIEKFRNEYVSTSSSTMIVEEVLETGVAVPGERPVEKSSTACIRNRFCFGTPIINGNGDDDDGRQSGQGRRWIIAGITAAIVIILVIGLSVGEISCCAPQQTVVQEEGTSDNPSGSSSSSNNKEDVSVNESGMNTSNEFHSPPSPEATAPTTTSTTTTTAATTLVSTQITEGISSATSANAISIHTSSSTEPNIPSPTYPPAPKNPFYLGDDFVSIDELGIEISKGLTVRLIAQTGTKVQYANGEESGLSWHAYSDAAGIVPLNFHSPLEDGYVYVSNSEDKDSGSGGVYGLYFDKDGNITEYKALLTGTTKNCGGGITPWNTWVSCEEFDEGQCWEIDPVKERSAQTKLGGIDGGKYESVAVDNRNPDRPVFYVTEDREHGALRRYEANGSGWGALHSDDGGTTTFLRIIDDSIFEWTTDEDIGQESAGEYYPNAEGIQVHEGQVYFMSKELKLLLILDVDRMTYKTESSGIKFYGNGSFEDEPDQNLFGPSRQYMYFTEDGGESPGVYARYVGDGTYFTLFQGIDGVHSDDETIGIALSPDRTKFYAGLQDAGYIFEFARDDGRAFE